MGFPLVSVVMSVYNGERFLREALDSILEQSFRDFEFIIIDDGANDGSPTILNSYQAADPRIRVSHQRNRGLIDSLNAGCQLACGKYIARMDADDIAIPDRLNRQIEFMEKYPRVGALGGSVELMDSAGRALGIRRNPLTNTEIRTKFPGCPFWHPTVMIRTSAFRLTGGYRKVTVDAEDHDLWLRMGERCELANLPDVLLRYRVHPDQISLRKCKQQTLSGLAAEAAAVRRRNLMPDPLDNVEEITPDLLSELGVSKLKQDTTLASKYLWRIRHYSLGGEHAVSLNLLNEVLISLRYAHVQRWVIADLRLLAASLCWRQSEFVKAGRFFAQAIWTRPIILARPLKRLFCTSVAVMARV
jgi:glycosyltransferase involved in cell wall biosynthesis